MVRFPYLTYIVSVALSDKWSVTDQTISVDCMLPGVQVIDGLIFFLVFKSFK